MSYSDYKNYINKRIKKLDCCCPNDSGSGNIGPRGQAGPIGVTGPTGDDGLSFTGSTGKDGLGWTGPTGASSSITGPTGDNGQDTITGPTGANGVDSTITGPTGANDVGGSTGSTGPPGPTIEIEQTIDQLVFGASFSYASGTGVPPVPGPPFTFSVGSSNNGNSYWLIPGGQILDTDAAELLRRNISVTPTIEPLPPSMIVPYEHIQITAVAVHLTSINSSPSTGWGLGYSVTLKAYPFCDVSFNGQPYDPTTPGFILGTDIISNTLPGRPFQFSRFCTCITLDRPIEIGCRVPPQGTVIPGLAISFAMLGPGAQPANIATPSISVSLFYNIITGLP